jgi:hypothetical protein
MRRFIFACAAVFAALFVAWSFLTTRACGSGDRYDVITKSGKSLVYRDLFFSRQYVQANGQPGGSFLVGHLIGEDTWSGFALNIERGILQIPRDLDNVTRADFRTMRRYTFDGHFEDRSIDESPPPEYQHAVKRKAAVPTTSDFLHISLQFKNGDTVIGTRPLWSDYLEGSSKRGEEKVYLTEIVEIKRRW